MDLEYLAAGIRGACCVDAKIEPKNEKGNGIGLR